MKLNQYSIQLGQITFELCDFPGFPSEGRNSQCNQQEPLSIKHKCWTVHPGHLLLPFLDSSKYNDSWLGLNSLSYMWSSVLYNKEEIIDLLPPFSTFLSMTAHSSKPGYQLCIALWHTASCFSISLPSAMKILLKEPIDTKFSIAYS